MTAKESMDALSPRKRFFQSVVYGVIVGFICGFVGAGGGMMMLLLLTNVLGYGLKTAVGTSVFIMTFTALTVAAKFANKASPAVLNRATGAILMLLGIVMLAVNYL